MGTRAGELSGAGERAHSAVQTRIVVTRVDNCGDGCKKRRHEMCESELARKKRKRKQVKKERGGSLTCTLGWVRIPGWAS